MTRTILKRFLLQIMQVGDNSKINVPRLSCENQSVRTPGAKPGVLAECCCAVLFPGRYWKTALQQKTTLGKVNKRRTTVIANR